MGCGVEKLKEYGNGEWKERDGNGWCWLLGGDGEPSCRHDMIIGQRPDLRCTTSGLALAIRVYVKILILFAALSCNNDPGNDGMGETPKAIKMQDQSVKEMDIKTVPKEGRGSDIKVLPSKVAAIHRVRWNMSKESERRLCYGGAPGIVLCEEIVSPEDDEKLLKKGKLHTPS
ncbi:hypothetical protein Ancab_031674 [Ancistrocladus abbreviatus]